MLLSRHVPVNILRSTISMLSFHTFRVFLFFLLFYVLLFLCARVRSSRDPGSAFFNPSTAYDLSYSAIRLEQGNAYLDEVSYNATESSNESVGTSSYQPGLCVGIATIARKGVRYFKGTVGTVLEGLSKAERADIHLILFVAHTDPSEHPSYSEPWLHEVADEVLLYNSDVDIDHLRGLETDEAKASGREKALFDYSYLLNACEAANTPYIIMLEDDVVALDGWYHRTRDALASVETQSEEMGISQWLYLRLFYTEEFLGWNSEEWPLYLFYSIIAICLVACALLGLRQYRPSTRSYLPNETILFLSGICTPFLIGLFFASGQAFVFPRTRISDLVDLYKSKHIGYVDMITEEYADANDEVRWAVTPSVVQHVGRHSSKGGDQDTSVVKKHKSKSELTEVEKLWNFGFERNNAAALRAEHDYRLQNPGWW